MNNDTLTCKKVLDSGYNVVIGYKGMVLTSKKDNVVALLEFLDSKLDFTTFSVALKNLDLDSAYLLLKLGIKEIITYEINNSAKALLEKNKANISFKELINDDANYIEIELDEAVSKIRENIK